LAGPNDTEQPGIGKIQHNVHVNNLNDLLVTTGIAAHSVENVKANLKKWGILLNNLIFHEGWFQFTIPVKADKIDKICFLRLDGDLYESTKICLEYFYPKIPKGGYVVVDDYNLAGCRRAVHEYLDKHHLMPLIIPIEIERINGDIGPVYWQIE
jgi:hypothetical protein